MRRLLVATGTVALLASAPPAVAGVLHQIDFVGSSGFDPEVRLAVVGHQVQWNNATGLPHTATAYDGVFDTGDVATGASSAPIAMSSPGRFEYRCSIHPGMRGRIDVHAGGGATPPPELDARPGIGVGSSAAYTLGTAAVPVSPGLTLADPNQIASAFVAIREGFVAGDVLELPDGNGIDATYNANSGTLTLTGAASVAVYEAAFRAVAFRTSGATGPRRVVFGADDDTGAHAPPDFRNVVVSAAPPAGGGGGGGGGAGGGGSTTEPPPPPPSGPAGPQAPRTVAPRLTLRRSTFTVDSRGRVTLRFTTDPSLRGTVDLLPATARAAQRPRLGRATFRANARGAVTVRVRLSPAARRALRRARSRRLRARVVIRAGTRTASRPVTLRRR